MAAAPPVKIKGEAVRVTGARELRAALRRLGDRALLRELAATNQRLAMLVVERARMNASGAMQEAAAGRLKASKAQAAARVTLGGKPYDLGAEFGAVQNAPRTTARGTVRGWNQFEPWRGNDEGAGYFLFPAIRDMRDEIIEQYADEIERIWMQEAA